MEKIMIYPYSKGYEPYVRNAEILGEYTVAALVSPRGWGYEGEVIADSHEKEYVVSAEFIENIDDCTCVWFVADGSLKLPEELLKEKLMEAVNRRKRILYTRYGDDNYEEMRSLIPTELFIEKKTLPKALCSLVQDRVYDIDTPVLAVIGVGMDTDKLAVELILRKEFEEMGYFVTLISSRRDGDWKSVYGMPEFVFNHSVSEAEKIIMMNHFVKQIEKNESPDLIIVGIPGAILPYDGIDHNEFGILAYEISFAVPCDVAVLCMMYNSQFGGDYKKLAKDIHDRFGFNVICAHIASTVMDAEGFFEERKMSSVSIDRSVVDRKISEIMDDTVVNILNKQGAEKAISLLVDALSC